MINDIEFISPSDQPALIGMNAPEWMAKARSVLHELGYKVHFAANHEDFLTRFGRLHYQLVLLEDQFSSCNPEENESLLALQRMSMAQRRHAAIFLMGSTLQTMNPFQAFDFSVHATLNRGDLENLKPILQQVLAENNLFLSVLRDSLVQISTWGK